MTSTEAVRTRLPAGPASDTWLLSLLLAFMTTAPGGLLAAWLLVVAAIALPGCGVGENREATRIRFADLVNVDVRDVPLLMAFDALAADGYIIEKTYLSSGTLIIDTLARGEADVAMANTQTAWTAIAKGADIRSVVEATGPSNILAAHARIRSCRDLDDKSVGVASTTGFSPLLLALFFERQCPGIRPHTLLLPEAGARAAALLSGRVEATMLPIDDFLRIEQQATAPLRVLMSHTDFPDIRIDALHVRRAWALEHPQAVQALIRAQLDAHRLVNERPGLLREESVRRFSMDAASAEAIIRALMKAGVWDRNGGLTAGNVQSTIEFLAKAGALPGGLTVDQVSDLSHLNAVLDQIGRP